ncbi:MAG: D-amino-acid oxidase [Acidobacteriota bacterium]|nr:D-amino-acid oxidase [Acidobacteriota bacterium]
MAGLTCAKVLGDAGYGVTVIADDFAPRTSAAAAAIWFPYAIEPIALAMRWARQSYEKYRELATVPGTGVSFVDFEVLSEHAESKAPEWAEALGADPIADCGPYASGYQLNVPLIDTRRYLPWLRSTLDVEWVEQRVRSLHELEGFEAVVNCSGYRASALDDGGPRIEPHRGIVLRMPNPGITRAVVFEEKSERLMYIVPRGDDVVLGGTFEPTDDVENLPAGIRQTIFDRCKTFEPRLASLSPADGELAVGIRPRATAVCLRREGNVVHNYGHGGSGFTVSWGCAADVLDLIRQWLAGRADR